MARPPSPDLSRFCGERDMGRGGRTMHLAVDDDEKFVMIVDIKCKDLERMMM